MLGEAVCRHRFKLELNSVEAFEKREAIDTLSEKK
jgi:hypothetical protein